MCFEIIILPVTSIVQWVIDDRIFDNNKAVSYYYYNTFGESNLYAMHQYTYRLIDHRKIRNSIILYYYLHRTLNFKTIK